jgi:hypothetical protein
MVVIVPPENIDVLNKIIIDLFGFFGKFFGGFFDESGPY